MHPKYILNISRSLVNYNPLTFIGQTNSSAISLNGLTIGADRFLVICTSLAASNFPAGTCDKTVGISGPADSNGDDQIAIVICSTACTSFNIIDIYGVPGEQGSKTNGHFFQYGRAERVAGRLTPKSVWNASDGISVFGNTTAGFGLNAADMTPRRWSAVSLTSKPSSNPSVLIKPTARPSRRPTIRVTAKPSARITMTPIANPSDASFSKPTAKPSAPIASPTAKPSKSPTLKPIAKPTVKPSSKPTAQPSRKPTGKPMVNPSLKPSARPTVQSTVLPFNLIITELNDPFDKSGARYIELYSNDGAGRTIQNPNLYLVRWTNGAAGRLIFTSILYILYFCCTFIESSSFHN